MTPPDAGRSSAPQPTHPMPPTPAHAHESITITKSQAPRAGFFRYDVQDERGDACHVEIRSDRDHEDLEWFIRGFLSDHPPQLHRLARAVLRLLR